MEEPNVEEKVKEFIDFKKKKKKELILSYPSLSF